MASRATGIGCMSRWSQRESYPDLAGSSLPCRHVMLAVGDMHSFRYASLHDRSFQLPSHFLLTSSMPGMHSAESAGASRHFLTCSTMVLRCTSMSCLHECQNPSQTPVQSNKIIERTHIRYARLKEQDILLYNLIKLCVRAIQTQVFVRELPPPAPLLMQHPPRNTTDTLC